MKVTQSKEQATPTSKHRSDVFTTENDFDKIFLNGAPEEQPGEGDELDEANKRQDFERKQKALATKIPFMEGANEITHSKESLDVLENAKLKQFFREFFRVQRARQKEQTVSGGDKSEEAFLEESTRAHIGGDTTGDIGQNPDIDIDIAMPSASSLKELTVGKEDQLPDCQDPSVLTFTYKWLRAMHPGGNTGVHCDRVYMGKGSSQLLTCWIPLMEVDLELGGLCVLSNSGNSETFAGNSENSEKPKNEKGDSEKFLQKIQKTYGKMDVEDEIVLEDGSKAEFAGSGWLTTDPMELLVGDGRQNGQKKPSGDFEKKDSANAWFTSPLFEPGDVVIMKMSTLHMSLTNSRRSELRLSCDTRWQPGDEPVDKRFHKFFFSRDVKAEANKCDEKRSRFGVYGFDTGRAEKEELKTTAEKQKLKTVTMPDLRKLWGID